MITKRIDAITKIDVDHRGTIISAPRSVKIELTSRCDLKCTFCATSHKLRKKGDMNFLFLAKTLIDLKEAGVKEIGLFFLGESLLYPKLVEAVKLVRDKGFEYIFLTTNGRLLTKDKAYDLMEAGLSSLKFSFNAENREKYKERMGVDAFDTVVANIRNAYKIREREKFKCKLYASSILYSDQTYIDMKEALDLIADSVDEHYWLPLYDQAGYTGKIKSGNMGRIGALRESLPCWTLFMEGHITWEGMLGGCCFAHESRWDFGDLKTTSFMKAWNSKAAQILREANINKDVTGTACEQCLK